ncbi:hypothetical protein [Sphingomonas sp. ERG5]|uniref:hypothetical protein n=1 Tax=Sphingomonas sp. ERG5 TaxID=1381597 RepID=UPI0013649333|nr:hypothetical protein [Sphingomonas sp. ERG5]
MKTHELAENPLNFAIFWQISGSKKLLASLGILRKFTQIDDDDAIEAPHPTGG